MKFLELKKSLECLCSIQNSSFLRQFQISILEPISTTQMAVKMEEIKLFVSGNRKGSYTRRFINGVDLYNNKGV